MFYMDVRFIQFEKLLNKVFVPKINDVFSKYSDLRIEEISVGESPGRETSWDYSEDRSYDPLIVAVKINLNKISPGFMDLATWIGYLVLNVSQYIFTEDLYLTIENKFKPGLFIRTAYFSKKDRLDNELVYKYIIRTLTDNEE